MSYLPQIALFVAVQAGAVFGNNLPPGEAIGASLAAYHEGAKPNRAVLRVVYFHPSDVKPQSDHEARITRIMLDIQDFLKVEMQRHGFRRAVLPLEMDDDKLRIHLVVGKDPADKYSHQSGQKIKREMRDGLKDRFDLDREFVLAFHGMCRVDGEREYFFYAPYYGDRGSNHQRGLCHVADCEILDPKLLTDTKRKMSYVEHNGKFTQTVAAFNTKYLGGVAHELGHGLSLPHNGQARTQFRKLGTALMGTGNHTYRMERWAQRKGTFLTFASAVRLAAHPLFTGSDRGRNLTAQTKMADLKFGGTGKNILISGTVSDGNPKAHAIIAYVDPAGSGDYDANTTVASVIDGRFQIEAVCVKAGSHQLRLVTCHPNGATSTHRFTFVATEDGEAPTFGPPRPSHAPSRSRNPRSRPHSRRTDPLEATARHFPTPIRGPNANSV